MAEAHRLLVEVYRKTALSESLRSLRTLEKLSVRSKAYEEADMKGLLGEDLGQT